MGYYTSVVCPICLADMCAPCRNPGRDQLRQGLPHGARWTGSIRKRCHDSRVDEYEYQELLRSIKECE